MAEELLWLHDGILDFDLGGADCLGSSGDDLVDQDISLTTPTKDDGLPTFVNLADLQHVQGAASCDPGITGDEASITQMTQPQVKPLPSDGEMFTMDEFLRSQGGWRPPVPCSHCRRLRLQCFMLQTTSANPNPVTSCSSCVALYRQCSLAGPAKREASRFETPQPVIGQLHGVYENHNLEDDFTNHPPLGQPSQMESKQILRANKRSSSRSNAGTRPLRLWFNTHYLQPYPDESEKERLMNESGLSRTQIDNWFSNARRRRKHSEQATSAASQKIYREGSPMPTSHSAEMTPLERWQHSPPDAEPAQFADIERAIGLSSTTSSFDALQEASNYGLTSMQTPDFDPEVDWLSLPASLDSSSNATSSCTSQRSYGARSSSSKRSFGDTTLESIPRKRRQRSKQSSFPCTECARTFTRKSDLLRHERAIHLHSSESWICSDLILPDDSASVWRMSQPGPECALCGHPNPDERHFTSHEFVACADRDVSERTFARKDHLWQHLYKFHRCRKWEGWTLDRNIERLRHSRPG